MNEEHNESSSSGCEHQIEILVSADATTNKRQKTNKHVETEVHELGYDPFSYCGRRIHVLLLTKLVTIFTIPFYLSIILFISIFGNGVSIMFACIILGSVIFSAIYGAFHGAKMCLVPFVILQLVFLIYDVILICLLLITAVFPSLYISNLIAQELNMPPFPLIQVLFGWCLLLTLLLAPLVWTTHVVYIDFLFITHVDEMLHLLKEANQKVSQDDASPNRTYF
ncbi:unnamed protein product [Caenorhabditis angaria]|uniref:Uncharacterized protein n=1 Tax=Caenorhabditis angaria TaxID=860376 RepID=A0A9P1N8M1_9PELO|nr:unnamed protein product [Caenorhabditis angaria]